MKKHMAQDTLCETCDRVLKTKDWNSHRTGKEHRNNEERLQQEALEKTKSDEKSELSGKAMNKSGDGCRKYATLP